MAYNAKTNWAIDNVVLPADMNRIEQGIKDVDTGKAPLSHTHTIANITGLQSALDGKASSSHSHSISNITGLQNALDAKASSTHTHNLAIASYEGSGGRAGFMSADEKAKLATIEAGAGVPTSIIDNLISQNTGAALSANQGYVLKGLIDGKANSSHSHSISNVSGLQSALDGKASSSHIHALATLTSHGFMSFSDKTKLDGISNKATETYVTDGLTSTSPTIALSANQGRLLKGMIDGKAPSVHAHSNATTSSAGFMSTTDKSKLNGIAANATKTLVIDSLTSASTTSALSANQGGILYGNLSILSAQVDELETNLPNALDNVDKPKLGKFPRVQGSAATGESYLELYNNGSTRLGYIGYGRETDSTFILNDNQGKGIELQTTGHFRVRRGGNTSYIDVATVKVGTAVPTASSLENGEIYIQY